MRAWADNGQIWCLQDGRRYRSSPDNLAVESEYYRLGQLDEQDKKVVRWLCVDDRSPEHASIAEDMIAFLDRPHAMLSQVRKLLPDVDLTEQSELVEINYVEDLYNNIENQMLPVLTRLRVRDLSSVERSDEAPWLATYLATQYFRTKSMEQRFYEVLESKVRAKPNCDWGRVWSVMRVILGFQVGASLYARFDLAEWMVMEAPKQVELVTSDQPLFNTKGDLVGPDGFAKEFAAYFPVTPEFAVLCDFSSSAPGVRTQLLPAHNALHFNERMAEQAFRQVFARRRDELDVLS